MQRSTSGSARRDPSPQTDPEPPIRRAEPAGDVPPDWLRRLVETEVVPRLAHRRGGASARPAVPPVPVDADVEALVELLLDDDVDACIDWIDALRADGVDGERLRDALIAPAARRLGDRWDDDRCDFAQVTIALGRLQALVHHLGDDAPRGENVRAGRVLLAKLPGADHLLGTVIVADAFRRAGWTVRFDPCATEAELLDAARSERFDVIGLSVGSDADYPAVRELLGALRGASLNPSVTTMAGGPALARWPALDADLGADLVPADAAQAVSMAEASLRGGQVRRAAREVQAAPPRVPSPGAVPAPSPGPEPLAASAPGATLPGRRAGFRRVAALRLAGTLASLTARAA